MAKIRIAGTIIPNVDKWIYDWLEMDAFCFNDLKKAIKDENEELEISINSPGGFVYAGNEIYTSLKNHKGKVTINITGVAASAASIIAMAGDVIRMSPPATMMIHNVSSSGAGNFKDMQDLSDYLRTNDNALANVYMMRTGKTREEVLEMMDKETWFTAQEAVKHGFADEIIGEEPVAGMQLVASASPDIIPPKIIAAMQAKKQQAQLDLIKLKNI